MARLIEDTTLRERLHVFKDREEAGRALSLRLSPYRDTDSIVLGIPSGGVPVAAEVARALGLPLDVVIVRKVQIPYNPEAGFGAVGPDGEVILNEPLLERLGLTEEEVQEQIERARGNVMRRNDIFRNGRPFPDLKDRTVILVDDGLASGYTMLSAIGFVRRRGPKKVVAAVPTASKRTADMMLPHVDELICLNIRRGFIFAVADAYQNWYDLEESEVVSILERFKHPETL